MARTQNGHASKLANTLTNAMKPAPTTPTASPANTMYGNSNSECKPSEMANTVASPWNPRYTTVAVTALKITGMKLAMVYSIITTSMANTTPASGVLKDAAMAAALPQATSERTQLFGTARPWPSKLETAAPRCTAGPSLPPERPQVRANTPPANCRAPLRHVMRP